MPCSDGCYGPGEFDRLQREEWAHNSDFAEMLCEACQLLEAANIMFPDGLSRWWVNHKERDRKRVEKEMAEAKTKKEKKAALAKLSAHERKLLGVER